jgi:hypothetical protein
MRRSGTVAAATLCLVWAAGRADEPMLGPGNVPPLLAQSLTPLLSDWIIQSRDAAIVQGVAQIPRDIRAALAGYVPDEVLERVRWRVGGGEMSLQENLFRFGYAPAVTLGHVVIFQHEHEALGDPKLWAHELKHVMQYEEWGIPQFAARYLNDYEAVEKEAAEYRWQWMKLTGRIPKPASAAD